MLGECPDHGYYRANECPGCLKKGKFLMNDNEILQVSRWMAGILRHFPEKLGVRLDSNGWTELEELSRVIGRRTNYGWIKPMHIEAVATTDPRGRYQVESNRVRATYGHTIQVDLSDLPEADLDELFYPTTIEEMGLIQERGLYPIEQIYVHLSGTKEKALEAGRVHTPDPIIVRVDGARAKKDGVVIRKAGKEVYLVKEIGANYLSKI
ncbi:MAG TPA: RNA 2'-phosphotransferase [Thermoplasmata archaeon]|nr:RNA 2'-phosphotransferase [Thermoplasmata archaeon]HIH98691.1 RNA 2'-phosphotransferase [Thermoplasmata archaeon]